MKGAVASLPTNLEVARRAYVEGRVGLDQFERCVERLLESGKADAHPPLKRPKGI